MQLGLANFLMGIKQIVMGGGRNDSGEPLNDAGFLKTVPVQLAAMDLATVINYDGSEAGAAVATLSGAYLAADETNARVIKVDAATDSVGYLTFPIPYDYDEATDELKIRLLVSQLTVSTDNDVQLDSALYIKTAGVALPADSNPDAPGTVLTAAEQWIEFDLSSFDLVRDQVVNWNLITNGANDTAGEEVQIHAIEIVYRSTLVSYNEETSAGVNLR